MTGSDRWSRLGRYAAVGLATNGSCYLLFLALIRAGVPVVGANGACYLAGVVMGYVGNRRWTFRSSNRHRHDMIRFVAAHVLGLSASVVTISVLVLFMPAEFAQIGAIGIAAATIYVALELFGFARQRGEGRAARGVPEAVLGD